MIAGRSLQDISQQVMAENASKKDYIASTTALRAIATTQPDGKPDIALQFTVGGQVREYTPTTQCINQIADAVGIPSKYANRMREEAPGLLATNVNHWFQSEPKKRLLRTLSNGKNIARAFMSDSYRPLDNYDLMAAAIPKLTAAGCEIRSCEITETRLYIQASTPRLSRHINQVVDIGGKRTNVRVVEAGVIIGNSEIGCGSIFVEPILFDLFCLNGAVMQRTLRRNHVGRRNENSLLGNDNAAELFTDATRQLDDKAFWSKVQDVVAGSMSEMLFNTNVDRMVATQQETINAKPAEIVEVVSDRFQFSSPEKDSLLLHLAQGGDFSVYGAINAVTRVAQDAANYDRAVELERLGGIIALDHAWLN